VESPIEGREGLEVIDAFVDGERVDPRVLKGALSDPAGRDYFVDAWMLREGMQEDRVARVVDAAPQPAASRRAVRPWTVAAALAMGLVGGYAAGQWAGQPRVPPVEQARSNAVAAPGPAVPADHAGAPAPPPTRVIQLEFQIDSSASGGG
jgi:hypothetical protein